MADSFSLSFQLAFQISPIILTGGIASGILGGMLPIVLLSQAVNFATGILSVGDIPDLDQSIFQFRPLQGSTLIEQKIGMYPFANQSVAANAVIRDPLAISMLMNVTARPFFGGYITKAAMMAQFQATLQNHNNSGGLYTIATPAFLYTNCVMTSMRDVSRQDTKQPQNAYQLDFLQPLVTMQQAQQAQQQLNGLMGNINSQVATNGAQSGPQSTLGNPESLATPNYVPAASNLAGTSAAGHA